ncbi:hypothetical protein CMV_010228 [Castanea mollissima]|uniref:Uncharacterized protein n=1 Tax=Castanea mollissima TaxID=60419 RepID=A0A8J4VPT6_9ROSI|nr:hypothetical protein CMV_010228 [Castanea mollissima]
MHKLKLKMKRKQIQISLFLALILIASQCYHSTAMRMHTAESVDFNLKSAQARKSSATEFKSFTWSKSGIHVRENVKKVPSGPNPIGNKHPPSGHN